MRIKYSLATVLFLILFPGHVFAADSQLSGTVMDDKSNPVAKGVLTFTNSSGKLIKAVIADLNGVYSTTIPADTYTISISGPTGSTLPIVTLDKQVLSGSTTRNFTIPAPLKKSAKPTIPKNLSILLVIIFTILAIGVPVTIVLFFRRKKKTLPETSSSN